MVKSIKNMSSNIIIPEDSIEYLFKLDIEVATPFKDIGVMNGGCSKYKKGFKVSRFDVCKHQLIFVISGNLNYLDVDNKEFTAKAGDILILPLSHQQHYWADQNVELLWFHLHGMKLWKRLEEQLICSYKSEWSEKIYNTASEFLEETRKPRSDSPEVATSYASLTCKYIEREINGSLVLEKVSEHENELNRLWESVSEDLAKNWTVQELADLIYVSPAHLHRMVRTVTKTTPMQAVRHLRLERARELLFSTNDSLTVIATKVGYETPYALSKSFKKHFAITPAEVRKQK